MQGLTFLGHRVLSSRQIKFGVVRRQAADAVEDKPQCRGRCGDRQDADGNTGGQPAVLPRSHCRTAVDGRARGAGTEGSAAVAVAALHRQHPAQRESQTCAYRLRHGRCRQRSVRCKRNLNSGGSTGGGRRGRSPPPQTAASPQKNCDAYSVSSAH